MIDPPIEPFGASEFEMQDNKEREDLKNRFTYHPPKDGQPALYEQIREEAHVYALLIQQECPASREKSLALTKLEEAVFWANAAIARHG